MNVFRRLHPHVLEYPKPETVNFVSVKEGAPREERPDSGSLRSYIYELARHSSLSFAETGLSPPFVGIQPPLSCIRDQVVTTSNMARLHQQWATCQSNITQSEHLVFEAFCHDI